MTSLQGSYRKIKTRWAGWGVGGGGCGEHLLLRAQEPARDVDG